MQVLNDILTTLRERSPFEVGVNHKIGEEILRDPTSVADVSIKSLAKRIGVSEPSLIRYCRSLGCDGFKDFKKYLSQSLVLEQKFMRASVAASANSATDGPGDERFDRISSSVAAALRSVSETEHFERIDEAAKILMGAQTIAAFGLGGSSSVLALEAQNRFFRLGLKAIAHTDGYLHRMTAATLKKGDVVLIISSTGQPETHTDSARIARGYGAVVIAMTPSRSPLAAHADITIPIELATDVPYHQPNPVRFAQLFVLDCIADRLALMLGKPAMETLRRVSGAVNPQQHYLPTGD